MNRVLQPRQLVVLGLNVWMGTAAGAESIVGGLLIGSSIPVGGGVRIHPENARMSGRHGVQYVAQCVACAALTPVVWQ